VIATAPHFPATAAERIARELFGVEALAAALPSERDQNFRLGQFVLKIANACETREALEMQNAAIHALRNGGTGLEWPSVQASRTDAGIESVGSHFVRLLTWIEGRCLADARPHSPQLLASLGRAIARIDTALADFDHPAAHRTQYWDLRQAGEARRNCALLSKAQRKLVDPIFDAWSRIDWDQLPAGVIHGDANDYNVLVDSAGTRVVTVLDFGDMVHTATICNLAIALAYVMLGKRDPVAAAAPVVAAYRETRAIAEKEMEALMPLVAARLAMSVCHCARQSREAPDNPYLQISNCEAWELLETLAQLPAGWAEEVFRTEAGTPTRLLETRRRHLGPSLSISYEDPLHIIRGLGPYLYDSAGRRYLDCVNNVAHVGHCRPRVTEAVSRQMALLNTNTRYLHEHLAAYIERLTAALPAPLSVVYLVCSGSEANELALRLARAHTGRDGVVVMETGYHGNTNALVDISPYKFEGPGGRGKPAHVEIARGLDPAAVAEAVRRLGSPAAYICESALSCAGQVILPPGYLAGAYSAIRAAGGVAIADEVQTGFGRPGTHFWMFETQNVVPDIVTLGKPIGNGHPLGAVITTREIADSFANGMEYFNTFGGNPVSCAAGLAVLDILRDESLQENARLTGEYLIAGLRELAGRHTAIGEVRGLGLFLGFDLPGADEASSLVKAMKEDGVLLSTDGPRHNVIKIKPPLVFGIREADVLLAKLDDFFSKTWTASTPVPHRQ
jgi:4-aminobutyrate aminotransferase-like enzyme/aminoglycoside phosphotransferase (APT) family kinase protein